MHAVDFSKHIGFIIVWGSFRAPSEYKIYLHDVMKLSVELSGLCPINGPKIATNKLMSPNKTQPSCPEII